METNPPGSSTPNANATAGTTGQETPGAGSSTTLPDQAIPDEFTVVTRGLPSGSNTVYVEYGSSTGNSNGFPIQPSDPGVAFPVDNLNRLSVSVPSGGASSDGIAYAVETST